MHTLYFVPGLGADERLFSKLKLEEFDKKFIKWIPPLNSESLPDYAKRLSAQINSNESFSLIGVSFGGMIAVEMAKILKPIRLILISSAKKYDEIPLNLKFFKYFPVYQLFSDGFIRWLSRFNKNRFGIFKEEEKQLFAEMLLSCPAGYLKGAMRMILDWKNNDFPESIIHIHGDTDYLFPIRKIKNSISIKGGTHFMPYHKAEEVEKILLEVLRK